MKKRALKIISLLMILALMSTTLMIGLSSCGGNEEGQDSNTNDISSIVDDLPRDDEGNFDPSYLEGVQLNMWSVIGQPDQDTLLNLVKEFNKEYAGMIEIKVTSVGHYDYYNALDSTYANDYGNFPDMCFMHNEKNIECVASPNAWNVDCPANWNAINTNPKK